MKKIPFYIRYCWLMILASIFIADQFFNMGVDKLDLFVMLLAVAAFHNSLLANYRMDNKE